VSWSSDYTTGTLKVQILSLALMYKVTRQIHVKYGNVIEIIRDDPGEESTPFQAVNKALRMRRLWKEESNSKVRVLIDGQVMQPSQAESWANGEYSQLPKCEECAAILVGDVSTHALSESLFCSPKCADRNYNFQVEKMNDNEETEFDL
jgi:hypothetical protein